MEEALTAAKQALAEALRTSAAPPTTVNTTPPRVLAQPTAVSFANVPATAVAAKDVAANDAPAEDVAVVAEAGAVPRAPATTVPIPAGPTARPATAGGPDPSASTAPARSADTPVVDEPAGPPSPRGPEVAVKATGEAQPLPAADVAPATPVPTTPVTADAAAPVTAGAAVHHPHVDPPPDPVVAVAGVEVVRAEGDGLKADRLAAQPTSADRLDVRGGDVVDHRVDAAPGGGWLANSGSGSGGLDGGRDSRSADPGSQGSQSSGETGGDGAGALGSAGFSAPAGLGFAALLGGDKGGALGSVGVRDSGAGRAGYTGGGGGSGVVSAVGVGGPAGLAGSAGAGIDGSGLPGAGQGAWASVAPQLLSVLSPLRKGTDGVHRMTLRLEPDELGPVSIVAEVRDGSISVQLRADHEAGQAALQAALPELQQDLSSAGFAECALELHQDAALAGNGSQQFSGRQAEGRSQRRAPERVESGAAVAASGSDQPAGDGLLDVRL
ncbi:hypothetical protein GCM10020218_017760 [Dactylosporangium vinaceum]